MWKILEFLSENFQFLVVKFSIYLIWRVFVMSKYSDGSALNKQLRSHLISHIFSGNLLLGSRLSAVHSAL